jgi:hypothetical protein
MMPFFTLTQAAKESKKSKSTISEAISSGRLSAVKDENGRYQIDPSELFRVYPPNVREPELKTTTEPEDERIEQAVLKQKVEFLERELNREREFVSSLERRLDEESAERRRLTLLLTHQQEQLPVEKAKRSGENNLWKRIFKTS